MPDLTLTLYLLLPLVGAPVCQVSINTTVLGFSQDHSCYCITRSADNVHTTATANIMSLCATWNANKVNVRGAHGK